MVPPDPLEDEDAKDEDEDDDYVGDENTRKDKEGGAMKETGSL